MIKDTIDDGNTEDAKMWISELQNELLENNVFRRELIKDIGDIFRDVPLWINGNSG